MKITPQHIKWLKAALHLLALAPLLWLLMAFFQGELSADAAKDIQHATGKMALKLLLATLFVSPLAKALHQPILFSVRRLLGLWCFAWATLHVLSYGLLELGLDFSLFLRELVSRNYLLLGLISWIILLLLALTSTEKQRRLLGPIWQKLHFFIYVAAITAPLHALLSTKVLSPELAIYGTLALVLLLLRAKESIKAFKK